MLRRLAVFVLLLVFPLLAHAQTTPTTVFPPDEPEKCASYGTGGYLNWQGVNTNVRCRTAKEVMDSVVGSCSSGQVVMYDGSNYRCVDSQTVLKTAVPSCAQGQVVQYKDGAFICATVGTFGGMYAQMTEWDYYDQSTGTFHYTCATPNSMTGSCSCPSGTSAHYITYSETVETGEGAAVHRTNVYYCM